MQGDFVIFFTKSENDSPRESKIGGEGRNRTGDRAFAEPCLTTWLPRLKGRETVSVKAEKSILLDTAQLTAVLP